MRKQEGFKVSSKNLFYKSEVHKMYVTLERKLHKGRQFFLLFTVTSQVV